MPPLDPRTRAAADLYNRALAQGFAAGPEGKDRPPSDAVVCAFGKIDGRMACCASYDFTVKGGSIGATRPGT